MFAQSQPIPRDIPLPLPLPEWFLISVLIISFLVHILFVNLMVGGTFLTLLLEIAGIKNPRYNKLAKAIEATVTVNKSLAIVAGVAPLLGINTVYTIYFYSANALTGYAWISVIPLVIIAFLLLYLHKYTWEKCENKKIFHISIISEAFLLFLFIPLIFLSNVNLMLFPEDWASVKGFFSTLLMGNVIPRYLHFLAGTLAVNGLFFFWYFGREKYSVEEHLPGFTKEELKKSAYKLTFYVTLSQLVFGTLNFFTLPWKAVNWTLAYVFITGIIIAAVAMFFIWQELKSGISGKRFTLVAILISVTVLFMGMGRHIYRSNAISPHKKLVEERTEEYQKMRIELKKDTINVK